MIGLLRPSTQIQDPALLCLQVCCAATLNLHTISGAPLHLLRPKCDLQVKNPRLGNLNASSPSALQHSCKTYVGNGTAI